MLIKGFLGLVLCLILCGCQKSQGVLDNSAGHDSGASPPNPVKGDASLSLHPHDWGASESVDAASAIVRVEPEPIRLAAPNPRITKIVWRLDAVEALQEAFAEGRPVLVDFWAEWCGPCHELDRKTFGDTRVQAALDRFVLVRVDVTTPSAQSNEMTARYEVKGYPTVLLIDGGGVLRERIERVVGVEAILGTLARIE